MEPDETMNWDLWNQELKQSFPSFNWIAQVFCHSNEKLTNVQIQEKEEMYEQVLGAVLNNMTHYPYIKSFK
jgi:hypothetical protein